MKMGHIHDAAILGAGLAGSSMAGVLAEMGWDTVLIDQHEFPRHKVCGEFFSPESTGILASLGLEKQVRLLQPSEMDRVRLTSASGISLEIPLPGPALGVSRYVLDSTLHQAVREKGVNVLTGAAVTSVCQSEQGYRVEIQRKGERKSIEARAVIGAWGRSPRSGLTGCRKRIPRRSYIGIKTHIGGIKQESVTELYFFPGGYLGISPIEGGRHNASALLTREFFHNAGKTVRGVMEAAARLNPALDLKLANGELVPGTQAAVAPVETSRKPIAWGLIPHVGDAAMVIPPLCGDGMAMALRSVELCAHLADGFLRGEVSLSEWRHNYTQSLRAEFSGPLRWGNLLQFLLGHSAITSSLFRLGLLSPGLAFHLVQATRLKVKTPPSEVKWP